MDVSISHSLLRAVASGEIGPVFRLHVPGTVVAFGRADRIATGYTNAVRAARAHGFSPVERLAGGRAAVFHPSTLAFSWATPDPDPRERTIPRFETISEIMVEAFSTLGVDTKIGELSGEYCPGRFSVHSGGVKVMGVGQRLIRGAAHVGGVVVVDEGHRIRDVLIPIYRSLGLDWDPRTAGALADRSPGLHTANVAEAITKVLESRFSLDRSEMPGFIVDRARTRVEAHLPRAS